MKTYLLKAGVRQAIAKAGETDIAVAYNAKTWLDEYPAGNPQLMVTTPGGKRVPVTVETVDNLITGQVPNELLAGPGVYSYVFVWTSGSTQLESGRCECLVLGSNLAQDLVHDSRRTPEWAERIFLAAEVIEGAVNGAMEARNTAADKAAEAAESEANAAGSAEEAEDSATLADQKATAAAASAEDAAASAAAMHPENYVAQAFSASSAYSAGTYVMHDGYLYRLTADHDADVTWENTAKVQVKVADDVGDLKSASDALPFLNEYKESDVTSGKYINSGGSEDPLAAWCITDYMPVQQGDDAYYDGITLAGGIVYSGYYYADKSLIGTFKQATGMNALNTNIPGLAFVRFSLNVTQSDSSKNFRFYRRVLATLDNIKSVDEKANTIDAKVDTLPYVNLYDKSDVTDGYLIASGGGEVENSNWCITDYMPVNQGDYVEYGGITLPGGTPYSAYYNSSKELINVFKQESGVKILDTDVVGLAYVRFSVNSGQSTDKQTFYFRKKIMPDYSEFSTLKSEYESDMASVESELHKVSIVLPDTVTIAVGRQITFYAPNYVQATNPDDYVYYWYSTLSGTKPENGVIRFAPVTVGSYTATLDVVDRYTGDVIVQKTIGIEVVANTTRTGKTVMFIGDSLTNAGYYPYEIQHKLSNNGVTSIGTRTSEGYYDPSAPSTKVSVNHEGRGGWSAQNYVSSAAIDGISNAFWNPSSSKFDFSYYMGQHSTVPDIVFINLGTNGAGNKAAEIAAIAEMIDSIHEYSTTLPVVVSAVTPDNATQGQYMDIYLTAMRKAQIEAFDGDTENVYVCPVYLNINAKTDFNTETVAESARNPDQVTRQIDGVHLSAYGYWKMADMYWSMIQKLL
jgi:lysophospholipase L1-like esterase